MNRSLQDIYLLWLFLVKHMFLSKQPIASSLFQVRMFTLLETAILVFLCFISFLDTGWMSGILPFGCYVQWNTIL